MRERTEGDGERDVDERERESDNILKQSERMMERERSGERMCLIIQHYPCSLFMALLEQPVEAIYTHTYCRHRLLP